MVTLSTNKRASFDYDLLDTFEGGIVLTGQEVKSAKQGHMQLTGSFLHVRDDELWLKHGYIAPYLPAGPQVAYDPYRNRKILLRRREIVRLIGKTQTDGLTLVPLRVYIQRNLVKMEFALARGKRKYEKREAIKKREVDRHMRERMKSG